MSSSDTRFLGGPGFPGAPEAPGIPCRDRAVADLFRVDAAIPRLRPPEETTMQIKTSVKSGKLSANRCESTVRN